ncbi:MAG: endopeptidase La [Gammaproteobacteria bacterium RIFCSPLOWO2_02_FULL_42_14]|nr:MAG: endopeptidase La [Gammaproteobacteria bacterium RIFCSPHIGHO2_02_FULL_42_43]OGT51013.1 MAG: endopeptidase La [Gammaproteobacteria bacterium RIFCSPHIGHO2_12_FULL_41_25]OGT61716.1 MAG: endopeptidase La [Gammaproteobacteria bacterium RIFCSPLOWO2_02_FULL_42_14]OGT85459.1 MAG: endopeptidase La [Gammaproteobacteria bacterium RIFCSPLOWO2_12_FULL_42_18]
MAQPKVAKNLLPLIPLRDVVVYPHMVIPLFVGRAESIKALEAAMSKDKQVVLLSQKNASIDIPAEKDLFRVGTLATVLQMLRLPDGTVKVLVEGVARANITAFDDTLEFSQVQVDVPESPEIPVDSEVTVLMRSIVTQFEQLVKANKKIPPELITSIRNIKNPAHFADSVAAHLTISIESRQKILETFETKTRLHVLRELIAQELELLEVEKSVQGRVKQQVEKSQRQYYLSEKLKAIQQELGELDENAPANEMEQIEKNITKAGMPKEAEEKAKSELSKLRLMPPMSAEATVSRNYLEALLQVPWKATSKINHNLRAAEKILEADHYGLKEVKERILEYLAVQLRVKKLKGPILCLVGPPGVGKTSLGQSIANATGREFARISLGGIRDEAEIRGHRRTYIGAMPGKIIQRMMRAKVRNPLFMLDEVDKMAVDFRGDPASALLEVLDPEQNNKFNDHYLEVDYDLSDVMFIATANSLNIPPALLDRMEVIRLPGYTEDEKLNIATHYLVPRQIEQSGLKNSEVHISEHVIREIIRSYTREAGVRNLERDIAKICRKVVRQTATNRKKGKPALITVTVRNLEKYLGVQKYRYGLAEEKDQVGQVTGLAWTEVGGELLTIEAQVVSGKGKLLHTGSLGDVMQESIHAALTVVRSRAPMFGVEKDFFQTNDFHVHVPEGATPKDGPSAGIGMCVALVSAITHIPVHANVAMTGEITLRGEVLPIGGLKEKLLAALRGGIKIVLIPLENKRDLKEIPKPVLESLDIRPIRWIDEALEIALEHQPIALSENPGMDPKKMPVKKVISKSSKSKSRQTH